jgi:hypothetical protein
MRASFEGVLLLLLLLFTSLCIFIPRSRSFPSFFFLSIADAVATRRRSLSRSDYLVVLPVASWLVGDLGSKVKQSWTLLAVVSYSGSVLGNQV